jgi:putative tryptophan/tyrosine transport system substrate-binding protein
VRRRDLLALSAVSAVVWPVRAHAATKQYRIAIADPVFTAATWRELPLYRPFFPELRRLGDVEGVNLEAEYFTAEGNVERYADLARRVVGRDLDLIVSLTGDLVPSLVSEIDATPIVAFMANPELFGSVGNLARPGGNLTGVNLYAGIEIEGKRLQLLKETAPSASRVAVLNTKAEPAYRLWRPKLLEYAESLGMSLIEVLLSDPLPSEIKRGFAECARQHADALFLGPEPALSIQARLITRLAEEGRLPAMYPYTNYSDAGGLMTYTFDPAELGRRAADDVHQILHGAKPGDIPVYQATRYKFTINMKAAKALGLTVPQSILAQADEVIE